jgi:hypothetical protein
MLPLGSGQVADVEVPAAVRHFRVAPGPREDRVLEARAGFGALTSSHAAGVVDRHGVRHAELDPEEVVRAAAPRSSRRRRPRASPRGRRAPARTRAGAVRPPAGSSSKWTTEWWTVPRLAVEERAAGSVRGVARERPVVRRRLGELPDDMHAQLV